MKLLGLLDASAGLEVFARSMDSNHLIKADCPLLAMEIDCLGLQQRRGDPSSCSSLSELCTMIHHKCRNHVFMLFPDRVVPGL